MTKKTISKRKSNKIKNYLNKVTPLSKLLAMILFVVLPIVSFYYGLSFQFKDDGTGTRTKKISLVSKKTISFDKCSQYGIDYDKASFYTEYTVKRGDTLLSIARDEISDVSRVGDLVYINQGDYPGMTLENPFIEIGYKIFLPPKYNEKVVLKKGSPSLLFSQNGEIVEILNNETWRIALNDQNLSHLISLNNDTIFEDKDKTSYKMGDCITAIYDGDSTNAVVVKPQ